MDDETAREERARTLLTLAAETVPVSSGPFEVAPRRPVWPWVVAVAAVVLFVVALPALLLPAPETPPDPVSPAGPVTVPQTVWMTEDQATRTLEDLGLEVDVHREMSCLPSDRVLRTQPAVGRSVDRDADVTIVVTSLSDVGLCMHGPDSARLGMQLLDLARFGTTHLAFAPSVSVISDGASRTLTPVQAADREAWGSTSPLADLRTWSEDADQISTLADRDREFACGGRGGGPFPDRPSVVVTLDERSDGVALCRWVRIYLDAQGRVDAVASEQSSTSVELFVDGEQTEPAEPTAEQKRVADAFASYARGGQAPALAKEVRLLLGNAPVTEVSAAQAADPATWRLDCEAYGEASCPVDALLPLRRDEPYAVTATEPATADACHQVEGDLPADLISPDALAASVTLSAPEPASCALTWEVQLWLNDDGAIYAANFAAGMP